MTRDRWAQGPEDDRADDLARMAAERRADERDEAAAEDRDDADARGLVTL